MKFTVTTAVLAAWIAYACGAPLFVQAQTPAKAKVQEELLLKVKTWGGYCRYGPCLNEIHIYANGEYEFLEDVARKQGQIRPALVAELRNEIASTDFDKLSTGPYAGTCATAYDGQESEYTFYKTPRRWYALDSCKVIIDRKAAIFLTVSKIMEGIYQTVR